MLDGKNSPKCNPTKPERSLITKRKEKEHRQEKQKNLDVMTPRGNSKRGFSRIQH